MGENKNHRKITFATKRESERREIISIIRERDSESSFYFIAGWERYSDVTY